MTRMLKGRAQLLPRAKRKASMRQRRPPTPNLVRQRSALLPRGERNPRRFADNRRLIRNARRPFRKRSSADTISAAKRAELGMRPASKPCGAFNANMGGRTRLFPIPARLSSCGLGPSTDHLLNPESAMTTVPDPPKANSLPVSSHSSPAVANPPQTESPASTPVSSDTARPQ